MFDRCFWVNLLAFIFRSSLARIGYPNLTRIICMLHAICFLVQKYVFININFYHTHST